ncbi:Hsp20/alpha crystallin family protein [Rufibacter sp. LB8]|uniref:Hsp20/alpha crystallin family protein n=1 Tax=Rufibacter sp. LB8 TaxID=2777781 RepID=UPI001CEF8436|nr:Hsp20/alpha crystallin family protein [Rufibacter sp. LB8]
MNTTRQNPALQDRMPQTFSGLLDRFFQDTVSSRQGQSFTPQVDLWETQNSYEVEVALPGLKKEDLNVEFQDSVLRVSGERKFNQETKDQKFYRVESAYGKFSRSFQLPDHVDGAAIDAQFADGILHITVPKVEEKVMKRQIAVK